HPSGDAEMGKTPEGHRHQGAVAGEAAYRGLRQWLEQVEKMGELRRVSGAHWDTEMGAITHMLTEKSGGTAPSIQFDDIPGYPKGYRTLYGHFSTVRRVALTLGMPLENERDVDIVKAYYQRMRDLKPLPPRTVKDGPILQNVIEGEKCDVLRFPVPRHHEADTSRFIGTADCVITQDPDAGWFNLGAYRSQVYDGRTIGCQITEGKHGRIHRDKYFARGQPMKVVILCGQDPLLFMLAGMPVPEISELDIAGGIRGEPIDVIRGPYTGFPIPADCEIALEGETVPGQVRPEGPPATRFTVIQIRQRYPGHARNALHVASNCLGGAYAGKWTVVVDEDIDAGDLDQVLWAMSTRFDPASDIDLIQKAWASKRDPLYLPGNFNNRILIDACIPYDMKLKGTFPEVVDVSADLRAKLRDKFSKLFH